MVRKIWVKMKLPFLYEKLRKVSMWLAMGWACNEKENTLIDSANESVSVEEPYTQE